MLASMLDIQIWRIWAFCDGEPTALATHVSAAREAAHGTAAAQRCVRRAGADAGVLWGNESASSYAGRPLRVPVMCRAKAIGTGAEAVTGAIAWIAPAVDAARAATGGEVACGRPAAHALALVEF
jgi:hypothetical protein